MAKRKSMTGNQNHDDNASSKIKKVNTGDNGVVGPWSDLNDNMLYLVMMQLGVVDYLSFSGVCKSWRILAVSNRCAFMASKPPMVMRISSRAHKKPCYLEDFEGRKFKTILPSFVSGGYVGLACGYLIFFKRKTREFWLVNPITSHKFNFPNFPITRFRIKDARAILVFSLSKCGWVFLVIPVCSTEMWSSIAGTGVWNCISCTSLFTDIHVFKGIIYTLNRNYDSLLNDCLYELRLDPEPKLTLLETKNALNSSKSSQLVSSGDNIYVMNRVPPNGNNHMMGPTPQNRYRFQELDFGEMKWVSHEKTIGEYASFLSNLEYCVAEKPKWGVSRGQGLLLGHNTGDMLKLIEVEKVRSFSANMWYFPHECLNFDLVND